MRDGDGSSPALALSRFQGDEKPALDPNARSDTYSRFSLKPLPSSEEILQLRRVEAK